MAASRMASLTPGLSSPAGIRTSSTPPPHPPALESDPGDRSEDRKAILRFRDGEWIAAYMPQGQVPDSDGLTIKIRLAERQRVIPALAATASGVGMQFVDMWTGTGAP